ncbi:MAG: DUF3089 domain-containing protein [Leptospiraceae bacterium]
MNLKLIKIRISGALSRLHPSRAVSAILAFLSDRKTGIFSVIRPQFPLILSLLIVAVLPGCFTIVAWMIRPSHSFEEEKATAAPDYSIIEFWAASPDKTDEADHVPNHSGLSDLQSSAKVDVFFVHPTSYLGQTWNADASTYRTQTSDTDVIRQASVFNGAARIFAPRYRQATMGTFVDLDSPDSNKALDRAYSDVRRAFLYYLEHMNQGRPYILAGHSQGAFMVLRLMQEFLDQPITRRDERFIVSYAPGAAIYTDQFRNLKPCNSPEQLSCYISWNSRVWGVEIQGAKDVNARLKDSVCINPVSWRRSDETSNRKDHLGSIRKDFQTLDTQFLEARCQNSILWVRLKNSELYQSSFQKNNLHPMDMNLFYLDLRKNARVRISAHQSKHPGYYTD